MPLNKRRIDALTFDPDGPTKQVHWDDELPGFGVRIYPSGKKAFVLDYRNPAGRKRFLTLGRYGVLTAQQAREKARREIGDVLEGTDPAEDRKYARHGNTLSEFADTYIERHAQKHKKSWTEDRRRLNKHVLPVLGTRRLEDIKRSDLAALHSTVGKEAPYEANRVIALLSVMFGLAADWGHFPETMPNPAKRIRKYRETSRDRWVRPHELPKLLKEIEAEPGPYVPAAFKLFLLTGLRKSELLGLRWGDVDTERGEIRLKDTKAGRAHVLPLPSEAVAILRELPRELGNNRVFPCQFGAAAMDLDRPWRRVRKRAGLEDVRLHDLRRTLGSMMATSGVPLAVIGKVLNHSNPTTTAIYARLAEEAPRKALEEHAKVLDLDRFRERQSA